MSLNWILLLIGFLCLMYGEYCKDRDYDATKFWFGMADGFFLSTIIANLI